MLQLLPIQTNRMLYQYMKGFITDRSVSTHEREETVLFGFGDFSLLFLSLSFRFEYLFNFDNTFEIHDDIEVLKRMGMAFGLEKGQCEATDVEKAKKMVPKALEEYIDGERMPWYLFFLLQEGRPQWVKLIVIGNGAKVRGIGKV